jgi:hypothetical protein
VRIVIARRTALLSLGLLSVLLTHAAHADLFSFTIKFTSGTLSGNEYSGIFATGGPSPNNFAPEDTTMFGGSTEPLLSLSITVEGINFHMTEDEWFPDLPFVRVEDDDSVSIIDYVGHSDGKKLGVFLKGIEANSVNFGDIGELSESSGDVIDVHRFSMPDSPGEHGDPIPPPRGGLFSGLTAEQARQQLGATYRYYGFRRSRNRTSPPASCSDWEWAIIDRTGVHWCATGCACGTMNLDSVSATPMVYDVDARRLRRFEDVQFDERRR